MKSVPFAAKSGRAHYLHLQLYAWFVASLKVACSTIWNTFAEGIVLKHSEKDIITIVPSTPPFRKSRDIRGELLLDLLETLMKKFVAFIVNFY